MSLKKPLILFSSPSNYVCWNCLVGHQPTSSSSATRSLRSPLRESSSRHYATVTSSEDSNLQWPELGDPRKIPTPYQIFNQRPHEAYSKRRFYELVKIYHPDRANANGNDEAVQKENIERYRLIIAANTILSDPERRSAYDRMGAGWSSFRDDLDMNREKWKHYKYTTYHRWRSGYRAKWNEWSTEGDPMYNATWEDWERWYERQRDPEGYRRRHSWSANFFSSDGPRSGVFASNYVFLSVVALLAALGGMGQATRVNQMTESRRERINAINAKWHQELSDARTDARDTADRQQSKEDRIRQWVRSREGYAEGEHDGRTARLGDEGFCGSGSVKDKDEVPFWKRPPEEWER